MSRILIVDDEPIIRRFLADGLADAGHEVTTATNGAEALDRVRERQSDIVLLDLLMPVMDGITFLQERQASPDLARTPVVVLTAGGIHALRVAARLRATAVLSKPLDFEALSTVIEHVLRQWGAPEDRRSVYSIDEALGSVSLRRLWHAAFQCTRADCNHGV